MQIDLFNDELALLVFLARFVGSGVGPSHHGLATFAKDVVHAVQTSDEHPVLGRTDDDVDAVIKQISST